MSSIATSTYKDQKSSTQRDRSSSSSCEVESISRTSKTPNTVIYSDSDDSISEVKVLKSFRSKSESQKNESDPEEEGLSYEGPNKGLTPEEIQKKRQEHALELAVHELLLSHVDPKTPKQREELQKDQKLVNFKPSQTNVSLRQI
jgi:hypothetical protein